jgi:zinc carboxypeptidase
MLPIEAILAPPAPAPPPGRAIGRSREGQEIAAYRFGSGPLRLSLIAGCHSDEPVGPAMLRRLVAFLAELPAGDPLLAAATWSIVPHVNPDGEEKNRAWSEATLPAVDSQGAADRAFDLAAYARHTFREPPGDDMEFGFPRGAADREARPENRAVAAFLAEAAPFHLHASFHGMFFASGPWFLLEPAWIDRTTELRDHLRRRVAELGYRIYDVDRGGEKGFTRIDRGFTTRPDSRAMAAYFHAQNDPETAAKFRPSSMEYVRALGGDPLTLVSEMPLFLTPPAADPETPETYGDPALRADLARLALAASPEELRAEGARRGLRGMPIRDQMRLQLAYLDEAMAAVSRA